MKKLIPDFYVDKMEDITIKFLEELGVKGVILDIDNTLVPPHTPVADERAKRFVDTLKVAGMKICVVSNNIYERAEIFCNSLGVDFICDGTKPNSGPFTKAMEVLKEDVGSIAVIGDQVFTDVWGGNRMGMITILIKPICDAENHFIKFKRVLENLLLKRYKK